MPLYEYRCRTCQAVYEQRRTMADADATTTCPDGHVGAVRLLPVFATVGHAAQPGGGRNNAVGAPMAGGCGGACACHPG